MHPRRSARHIAELEEENVQLRGEVAQLSEKIEKLGSSAQAASGVLEGERKRFAGERKELLAQIECLKGELEEWEEMRPELERVAEALEKMDDMKREFAEKTEKLQRQLADARHGSFRRRKSGAGGVCEGFAADFSEEGNSDILDFEGESPFIEPQAPRPLSPKSIDSKTGRAHKSATRAAQSEDEDDWLIPLPD